MASRPCSANTLKAADNHLITRPDNDRDEKTNRERGREAREVERGGKTVMKGKVRRDKREGMEKKRGKKEKEERRD